MHQHLGFMFVLMLALFSLMCLIPFHTISLSFIPIVLYDILTYLCPFYLSVLTPYLTHLFSYSFVFARTHSSSSIEHVSPHVLLPFA